MRPDLASAALVFAEVAECGSFTLASKRLRLSKSTVSNRVRYLEEQLATRLLVRTTRALSLSDEGARFLESVLRMREHWVDATDALRLRHAEPRGVLRVTAPVTLSDVLVAPIVSAMMAEHAELNVDLMADDRSLDLVRDNIDVALRIGELTDSDLVAKRVGTEYGRLAVRREGRWDRGLCGDEHAQVRTLERIPFVGMRGVEGALVLSMREDPGVSLRIAPTYRCRTEGGAGLLNLVLADAGVAVLPDSMLALGGDGLRVVLPAYTTHVFPLWLLSPSRRYRPARVVDFVRRLETRLQVPIWEPA